MNAMDAHIRHLSQQLADLKAENKRLLARGALLERALSLKDEDLQQAELAAKVQVWAAPDQIFCQLMFLRPQMP
jgi:hypothetical protein